MHACGHVYVYFACSCRFLVWRLGSDGDSILSALLACGLTTEGNTGGGDCFFRAVAQQLGGTEDDHPAVRHAVCELMEREPGWLALFGIPAAGWPAYVSDMRAQGSEGGAPEAFYASAVYGRPILCCVKQFIKPGCVAFAPLGPALEGQPIRLLMDLNHHWESVIPSKLAAAPAAAEKKVPTPATGKAPSLGTVPVRPSSGVCMC